MAGLLSDYVSAAKDSAKDKAVDYGKREDGTNKGSGWLGEIKNPYANDGRFSTELSIGVNLGGKDVLIPLIVPTLTKDELDIVLKSDAGVKGYELVPESIVDKAVDFSINRIKDGKSPFFN